MRFALPARYLMLPAAFAVAVLFLTVASHQPHPAEALTNCSVADVSFDSEEQQFLTLINQYRAQNGLAALTASINLNRSASWLANDMATKNYLDHTDSLGRSLGPRLQQCDTQIASAAENIAGGYTTAAAVFAGWKASPGHNTNMLGAAYKQIGIGRFLGGASTFGWYWATDFSSVDDGTRAGGGATSAPASSPTTTAPAPGLQPAANAPAVAAPPNTSAPSAPAATATRTTGTAKPLTAASATPVKTGVGSASQPKAAKPSTSSSSQNNSQKVVPHYSHPSVQKQQIRQQVGTATQKSRITNGVESRRGISSPLHPHHR